MAMGSPRGQGKPGPFHIAIAEPEILLWRSAARLLGYVEEQTVRRRRHPAPIDRPVCSLNRAAGSGAMAALHETLDRSEPEDHVSSPHLQKVRRDETLPCGQEGKVTSEPTPAD